MNNGRASSQGLSVEDTCIYPLMEALCIYTISVCFNRELQMLSFEMTCILSFKSTQEASNKVLDSKCNKLFRFSPQKVNFEFFWPKYYATGSSAGFKKGNNSI